ncbi:hypothetical protein C7271_01040 [filamentous cyanobacterium CCP5]|nr:hypothetical protein C7271_01040 [filamentous cyanobacterium CCP5]
MMTIRRQQWRISAGAIAALVMVGCGPSKVSQCNQLADVVNQTQGFMQDFETEIQSFSQNASQVNSLEDIKSAAGQYTTAVDKVVTNLDTMVTDLQETELQDETLVTFRDQYIEVVDGFSSALQEASSAMDLVVEVESEADLPGRIEESQQQTMSAVSAIENLSATEAELISNVNSYCGAAPTEENPEASPE